MPGTQFLHAGLLPAERASNTVLNATKHVPVGSRGGMEASETRDPNEWRRGGSTPASSASGLVIGFDPCLGSFQLVPSSNQQRTTHMDGCMGETKGTPFVMERALAPPLLSRGVHALRRNKTMSEGKMKVMVRIGGRRGQIPTMRSMRCRADGSKPGLENQLHEQHPTNR